MEQIRSWLTEFHPLLENRRLSQSRQSRTVHAHGRGNPEPSGPEAVSFAQECASPQWRHRRADFIAISAGPTSRLGAQMAATAGTNAQAQRSRPRSISARADPAPLAWRWTSRAPPAGDAIAASIGMKAGQTSQ